ncbi:uncharacterized protein LOC116347649 [Contarinia nasturtii]|uniref:uncharacterized protein LOC116347649 n=1 Tax=Contarinia nasturtii TaxID=265458 RepID=UPI0012D3B45F|nr:uncharacterized protein LOC116347649 [Contarinia nasturtii]
MNFFLILHVIIGASIVTAKPVDVNNDDRPLINYIAPHQIDDLPIVEKERTGQLEYEGIPSKGISIYDQSQKKFGDILRTNAEPIVDTIQEEEKYGNDGNRPWDRAIVNTLEKVSVFVNNVIETPKQFARSITQKITDGLNVVGAKIVGL